MCRKCCCCVTAIKSFCALADVLMDFLLHLACRTFLLRGGSVSQQTCLIVPALRAPPPSPDDDSSFRSTEASITVVLERFDLRLAGGVRRSRAAIGDPGVWALAVQTSDSLSSRLTCCSEVRAKTVPEQLAIFSNPHWFGWRPSAPLLHR